MPDIEKLIARDCAAQGLPVRVTDSGALARIAAVIGASGENGERRASSTRRPATEEEATRVDSTAVASESIHIGRSRRVP